VLELWAKQSEKVQSARGKWGHEVSLHYCNGGDKGDSGGGGEELIHGRLNFSLTKKRGLGEGVEESIRCASSRKRYKGDGEFKATVNSKRKGVMRLFG